jgi:hypothetical protein
MFWSRKPTSIETCVAAFEIWVVFFLVSTLAQIALSDAIGQAVAVSAGLVAIGTIICRWFMRIDARPQIANLSLVIAASLIALDIVWAVIA